MHGLANEDAPFSEQDLVRHFRGEKRQMERYIIDAQRDAITQDRENRLLEFVEWSGKGTSRPMAYSTLDQAFFQFLCQRALATSIEEGLEDGTNQREIERRQMVRLMSLFADVFFVGQWDPEIGGRQLESKVSKGEEVPIAHLRAWRIARQEVAVNVMRWVRLVMKNHFAVMGQLVDDGHLLLNELPDRLWINIEAFLRNLSMLPCWTDLDLSQSVFGPKQNLDYWRSVFQTGRSMDGTTVLARSLNLHEMIAG